MQTNPYSKGPPRRPLVDHARSWDRHFTTLLALGSAALVLAVSLGFAVHGNLWNPQVNPSSSFRYGSFSMTVEPTSPSVGDRVSLNISVSNLVAEVPLFIWLTVTPPPPAENSSAQFSVRTDSGGNAALATEYPFASSTTLDLTTVGVYSVRANFFVYGSPYSHALVDFTVVD